mgnify:CR=1 FL=1
MINVPFFPIIDNPNKYRRGKFSFFHTYFKSLYPNMYNDMLKNMGQDTEPTPDPAPQPTDPIMMQPQRQERSAEEIAAANVPAVYFDDNDVQSSSDNVMVVNCQPRAKARKNCLSGPGFMPVDTKGKQQVRADFASISHPISCLISFGTVDSRNMMAVALRALLSDQQLKETVQPVCLIGPHFQQCEIVETLLSAFSQSKIIRNCQSVLELPFLCDIAIGAPGVSHAERLYAGIPTVLVPQSESHIALCMNWHDEGCALYADPEPKHIARQINALIANNFNRARTISNEGQRVIDGKGASRIVAELALQRQSI